jgi:hypothetical protein
MRYQRGFSYLAILFFVAISTVALAATGVLWSTERKRDNEIELLAIGTEFQYAIGLYYQRSPGAAKRYPQTLNDLLKDARFLTVQRYLRQIYVDPMTGKREWGLIQAPEGGVMGIYSLSSGVPMKQTNFPALLESFNDKTSYQDWRFIYRPPDPATTNK